MSAIKQLNAVRERQTARRALAAESAEVNRRLQAGEMVEMTVGGAPRVAVSAEDDIDTLLATMALLVEQGERMRNELEASESVSDEQFRALQGWLFALHGKGD